MKNNNEFKKPGVRKSRINNDLKDQESIEYSRPQRAGVDISWSDLDTGRTAAGVHGQTRPGSNSSTNGGNKVGQKRTVRPPSIPVPPTTIRQTQSSISAKNRTTAPPAGRSVRHADQQIRSKAPATGGGQPNKAPSFMASPGRAASTRTSGARSKPAATRTNTSASSKGDKPAGTQSKKKFNSTLLITLLSIVILVPLVYLAGKVAGIFPGANSGTDQEAGSESFVPSVIIDPTLIDTSSEEFQLALSMTEKDIVYPGVFLGDINLANLSREELQAKLKQFSADWSQNNSVVLNLGEVNKYVKYSELGIKLAERELLSEIWSYGRNATAEDPDLQVMARYEEILNLEKNPVVVELKYQYSETQIQANLKTILSDIIQEPISAKATSFDESSLRFKITPEVVGKSVDFKAATEAIIAHLDNRESGNRIEIETVVAYPEIKAVDLDKQVHLLSEAKTNVYSQHEGRMNNMYIAAKRVSGQILQPGEVYSYMSALGPITVANGFENASVLIGGEYIDGIGGGLCQPSTTLFQAAATAGLTIIDRRNHGLVGQYFKPGMDAMVSTAQDLKFRNDSKQPVAIIMKVTTKAVTVRIYGNTKPKNVTIKLSAEQIGKVVPPGDTVYIEDETLSPGKIVRENKASSGTTWQTYLNFYQDGKFVRKEKLWRSRYNPRPETYRVAKGFIPAGFPGATEPEETTIETTGPEPTSAEATTEAPTQPATEAPTGTTTGP
ncbi:MAG: VanW family protein [Bacillota bacterium]|jgi:vancomycin resistance protein YoaR|nr:VanW family protein [Bacillota bacterium]